MSNPIGAKCMECGHDDVNLGWCGAFPAPFANLHCKECCSTKACWRIPKGGEVRHSVIRPLNTVAEFKERMRHYERERGLSSTEALENVLREIIATERERCAMIVDSYDNAQWSDTQRNVVRIAAHEIRGGKS